MASADRRRLTKNWLQANAQLYQSPDRIQPDVLVLLDRVPSLRPKTEIYTYDDGRTQLLLCIHGTIPIAYRATAYNIPVAVWLTLDYPREPPIVYVVPTSDMLVRQSPYVDVSGRCDLEYMRNWRAKPDSCSVQGLIDAMIDHFSAHPPLYARPRAQETHLSSSSSSPSPVPVSSSAPAASSDHDRSDHVASPPPLPRKPQQQQQGGNSVGVGPRPSPAYHQPASPSPHSSPYPHGPLQASQQPQTRLSEAPPAIPPHPQAPGTFHNYPVRLAQAPSPASASVPMPVNSAQAHTQAASPPPADPSRPPPVPPLPAGIQGASAGRGMSSPPPYYYSPGPGGRESGVLHQQTIQQQQQQQNQQQQGQFVAVLQQQPQPQQQQIQNTQTRVTSPASPPPPPPVPPSPFHVPRQQGQEQQHQQRFTAYGQAPALPQVQAQAYGGYGGTAVGTPSPPGPGLSPQLAPPNLQTLGQGQGQQGYAVSSPVGQQLQLQQTATGSGAQYYNAGAPVAGGGGAYAYASGAPVVPQQQRQAPPPPRVPPPDLLSSDDPPALPAPSSAPSTTAPFPPRPPNPELQRLHAALHTQLRSSLAQLQTSCAASQQKQLELQRALLAGAPAVADESARLTAVRDVCRGVSGRLREVVSRTEGVVGEVRRRGEVEVDEMVCATSIVENQLINLVAEDNAIEDTMYHLHRALNTGRIDLERFLRTTRVLAEEQFMKRALVEKIQKGLPMGMSMHA